MYRFTLILLKVSVHLQEDYDIHGVIVFAEVSWGGVAAAAEGRGGEAMALREAAALGEEVGGGDSVGDREGRCRGGSRTGGEVIGGVGTGGKEREQEKKNGRICTFI